MKKSTISKNFQTEKNASEITKWLKTQAFQSKDKKMIESSRTECPKKTLNLQFYANIP